MEIQPITDRQFNCFRQLFHELAGIDFSVTKKMLVAGRLMKRLKHYNLGTYDEYFHLVTSGQAPDELTTMVGLLTTNETHFFREPAHFNYLQTEVLPPLRRRGMVRIWSAASSSGEEPYSIAMAMAATFLATTWEVLGSDINQEMLERARAGIYPIKQSDEIPEHFLRRYCLKGVRSMGDTLLIDREIRQRVNFRYINLVDKLPNIGSFDVIFLRNVLIYFNRENKRTIVNNVSRVLKPGGYLIVGHSESLHGICDEAKLVKLVKPTIYQKRGITHREDNK
ncbi:MAG: protein-glutamate O-methyltransferase CheR [Candidatus Sedimenticola sp. (ex Thyasira tokunagai)]